VTATRASSDGGGKKKPAAKKAPAKKTATKKASAKKPAAKKTATKKTAATKPAAKKTAAKKKSEEAKLATEATEEDVVQASEGANSAVEKADASAVVAEMPAAEPADQPESADVPVAADSDAISVGFDRIVAFHLAGQRYAVPIDVVQEIQQIVAFSEVPTSGGTVVGMINLRGTVIPAVDARALIGLAGEEYHVDTPMIICRVHGRLVAVIVDEVDDVVVMPGDCLQKAPAMHDLASKMIGVCRMENDLVYLLDIEALVSPTDVGVG
jgi:chemotaxis signal transduction protein